jgi:cytochrome c biogenesis protein CcmG, thiol:disulfide interchange protein DsbE
MTLRRAFWRTSLEKLIVLGFLAMTSAGLAAEQLALLKVGKDFYTNVTVTSVSATDIYFSHAQGMGNAKLKSLEAEQQKRFKFDSAKASEVEKQQAAASAQYFLEAAKQKPESKPPPSEEETPVVIEADGDPIVTKLYARSFRGQSPPQIVVEEWLTPAPVVKDKFVLLDFWLTWAEPCRRAIPHLNELQAKFKDRLIVIGLSTEAVDDMKKMTTPKVGYYVGTDTQARTFGALEVKGVPHTILLDPKGIVRFEGPSVLLEEQALERLIAKYSN